MEELFPISIDEIAKILNADVIGNRETLILGLNRTEDAQPGELTFVASPKFKKLLKTCEATCFITSKSLLEGSEREGKSYILVENPYEGFIRLLMYIDSRIPQKQSFIHPTAIIDPTAEIADTAYIGPYCIVGRNTKIGSGTVLHAHISIADYVSIGEYCILYPNISIYSSTKIGNRTIIHAGAVIGSDGFGYVENKDGSYTKIPQLGNVRIGDDVEIGANTTIDRAVAGSTVIDNGVKIDNLVMVAHNVHVGENSAMVSQVGIAGSCTIGKRNRIGGQVGFSGHISMADDVTILARSGVHKNIEKAGVYFGAPIEEKTRGFKILVAQQKLPEFMLEMEQFKKAATTTASVDSSPKSGKIDKDAN